MSTDPLPLLSDSAVAPDSNGSSLSDRLLQTMPWGVLVLTRQGVLTSVNTLAQVLLGRPAAELVGLPLAQALPPSCPPDLRQALHEAVTAVTPVTGRFYVPHSQQWISMTTEPAEVEVLVYWQDATEVVAQQLQYEDLANNLPNVVTRWDADLRLCYANKALLSLVKQPLSELLGKTVAEMGAAAFVSDSYTAKLRQVFAAGESSGNYFTFPTSQGERYFHLRLIPELQDGRVYQVLAISHEITELKQVEIELRASNKLLMTAEKVGHTGSYEVELATMSFRFSDGMFHLFGEAPQSFVPTLDFIDSRSYRTT